jgi:hypothetical protein
MLPRLPRRRPIAPAQFFVSAQGEALAGDLTVCRQAGQAGRFTRAHHRGPLQRIRSAVHPDARRSRPPARTRFTRSSTTATGCRSTAMATECACSPGAATTGAVGTRRSSSPPCSCASARSPWTTRRSYAARTASRSSTRCTATAPSARRCCTLSTSSSSTGRISARGRWVTLLGKRRLGIVLSQHTDEDGATDTDRSPAFA